MTYEWKPNEYVSHLALLLGKGCYATVLRQLEHPPQGLGPEQLALLQEAALQQETTILQVKACIDGLLDE